MRQKEGVNESLYEELVELLSKINSSLEGKDSIPKNLAEIFFDMYGAVTSCADLYEKKCNDVSTRLHLAFMIMREISVQVEAEALLSLASDPDSEKRFHANWRWLHKDQQETA